MTGRDVVDYALQRRAMLADLAAGRIAITEACDAHPYLLLAARHYGEGAPSGCPVCDKGNLRNVHYVYGNGLGRMSGQAKSRTELAELDAGCTEFDVYVVEVCPDCSWNQLIRSFVLGSAAEAEARAAGG
jgi:hypothetical protein